MTSNCVLIIDDEPAITDALRTRLEAAGCVVLHEHSGRRGHPADERIELPTIRDQHKNRLLRGTCLQLADTPDGDRIQRGCRQGIIRFGRESHDAAVPYDPGRSLDNLG